MKYFLIISSFFLVLISTSLVGYHIVSANEKVIETHDDIALQSIQENYLTPYGYTLENPNIITNPYGTSPLSAMILFETEEEEEVKITIPGKIPETTFTNTYDSTKTHIIPIYGLYPDTENKIEIACGKKTYTYTILTEALPKDFLPSYETSNTYQEKDLIIYHEQNYIYGIDKNNEIRWLYQNNTYDVPYLLENNHLLIPISSTNDPDKKDILIEIDFTGKIYKQYHLNTNTTGLVLETENSLFIVTNNLIEMDKQNGTILNTYPLETNYEKIILDDTKENIILSNHQEELIINLKNKTQTKNSIIQEIIKQPLNIFLYTNKENYLIQKGIKLQNQVETKQSKKKIFLVGYISPDKNYKNYNIEINQTSDNIQISGTFSNEDEVYIILDKFLDKRIYDFKESYLIINKKGLSGKYSIYIKINNTIYKTNTYVKF